MRSRPDTSRSISGPPKRKCHNSGLFSTSSHGPIPGNGASMRAKRMTRSGYCAAKAYPTIVADVVRHEVRALDPECVEQAGNILTLCLLVVSSGRAGREPHPAQIGSNDGMVAG